MVAERPHILFLALIDHDDVVIAAGGFNPHLLENVFSSILTVFAVKYARKWWFWFVWRSLHAHDLTILRRCLPLVRVAICAEGLRSTTVRTRVGAESGWKLWFQVFPAAREIRGLIPMWWIRQMIVLAKIRCLWVVFAVRRMITQWFHAFLVTFVHHNCVEVATCLLDSHALESVIASIGSVPAAQFASKWRIWFVGWCQNAHYFTILCWSSPSMRVTMGAQSFCSAAMRTTEGAKV
jgi:hypothetical protein